MIARRFFVGGLIVTCLFAFGHLAGFLQGARAARHDPRMADLTRAMREHKTRMFGFEASLLDFREYFSLNFSVLLLLAGLRPRFAPPVATFARPSPGERHRTLRVGNSHGADSRRTR